MVDRVGICKMALGHIRAATIEAFEEASPQAGWCRTYYDIARQVALSGFNWGFARRRRSLVLHTEEAPEGWLYRYQYPSDCLKARYIELPNRNPRSPAPFEIELDAAGDSKTILTDVESAILIYTVDVTNTARFTAEFVNCFSWLMGSYLAMPVAGSGTVDHEKRCFQFYELFGSRATASDANEGQEDENPPSEFEEARE
jgi:hypothetical protein